jgi:hypothetical protein
MAVVVAGVEIVVAVAAVAADATRSTTDFS